MSLPLVKLSEYIDAFAVPGSDSVLDMVHPDTGRSMVYGKTLEQIRAENPGAEVVNFFAWMAAKAERQHTPVVWSECPEARYHEMLEVLPPAFWQGGLFLVGEPWDHDAGTGQPRYAAFWKRGGVYLTADRPMTCREAAAALAPLSAKAATT